VSTLEKTGKEDMSNKLRSRLIGSALLSFALVAATLVVAAPAQAYGELTVRYALVNTDSCARVAGSLSVTRQGDYCVLSDSADGTYFRRDVGGVGMKVELHDRNGMVAKQEFHPYGEVLWVYDTRNDDDTVYTWLHSTIWHGPYAPTGTSAVIDKQTINLSLAENSPVILQVYDDQAATDFIFSLSGGRA
jgi:hypothetical protein